MVVDPSEGDRRVVVICLTVITSNPRLTSPSDISSAGVLCGRWRITAHRSFIRVIYPPHRPRTETPVVLLVSADRTENVSRGSYCVISLARCPSRSNRL
jgi:hypothetical protein